MRLTNTIRDAFIAAVMQNVPSTDYKAEVDRLIRADVLAQLPPKVRAVAEDKDIRHHLNQCFIHPPGGFGSVAVLAAEDTVITPTTRTILNLLWEKEIAQREQRQKLEQRLRACAYGVSTRKALAEMLPEFERFLPEDTPAANRSLPVVTGVVQEFIAAGFKVPA